MAYIKNQLLFVYALFHIVFNKFLKVWKESQFLIFNGNKFQSVGAATGKAR